MNSRTEISAKLAPLASDDGLFSMLALDQRESLRGMLAGAESAAAITDEALVAFKDLAKGILTPHATAVLLDRHFGLNGEPNHGIAPGCSLMLAADILHQVPGQPVDSTEFDSAVTPAMIEQTGAVALKLLVMWRADESVAQRSAIVEPFLRLATDADVAAVVEGIVVPPAGGFGPGERDAAILAAAKELSEGADLYKAQVPGYAPGDTTQVREAAVRVSETIDTPWVVLSNGVAAEDFASAVEEACRGGASGFLAGRAIWADTTSETDRRAALEQRSVQRLERLRSVVRDATAARAVEGAV